MLNCEETTRLVSEGLDRDLTLGERVSLKFHMSMCSACRNVKIQMNILRQATSFYMRADLDITQIGDKEAVDSKGDES